MNNPVSPPGETAPIPWRARLLHHAAAWGAALCALTPLLQGWMFEVWGNKLPARIWPGHLLIDSLEAVTFVLFGLVAGGWWWWTAGWQRGKAGVAGALGWLVLGLLAVSGLLPRPVLEIAAGVYLLWALASLCLFRKGRETRMGTFLKQRRPWNAVFFVSFVLLNTAGDVILTASAPPGWLAMTSFVIARLLTHFVLASALWMLLYVCSRWLPRGSEWVGWTAVMFTPLVVVVDIALRLMWTKGIYLLCSEIENGGRVDVLKIVEGGGISLTPGHIAAVAACISIAPAWYLLSRYWSRIGGIGSSTLRFGGMALTAWFSLMALQAVEAGCKSTPWRLWESRTCALQLTPFSPPPGLATFKVAPADPVLPGTGDYSRRPDIYLFIVESMRADAIAPQHAPFLSRWKAEECQQIAETRSAANATHLSWFSILHGRLPYYEERMRPVSRAAPLFTTLHKAGFRLEMRSAGNFDYCSMLQANFGDGKLMQVLEHVPQTHPDYHLSMGEREALMWQRLRDSVDKSKIGGTLRIATVDCPHYPYKWDEKWTPPYADYEKDPLFPVRPSPEEVERIRHRYWNSIGWADHLIGDFIAFLKETRRYDNSMIILTGDHGEEFKEHGSWFHCSALNDPQTRVPLLIKWPKDMGRGPALKDASHLDIVPTILDAVGFPESAWQGMPGRSLYREKESTSLLNTCYAGQNGETMLWRRDGWEAAFSWSKTWELRPPDRMWLERLTGPHGPVDCENPAEYEAELRRRFPDAFSRVFNTIQREPD
ncbi:MAG TPA: sulfatase-like hydrolase/transferase [Verrucomicrobiales bacterium]|nr:sulfatase-like hydrolase/transferase [Verrucomicrobiales bacterium]